MQQLNTVKTKWDAIAKFFKGIATVIKVFLPGCLLVMMLTDFLLQVDMLGDVKELRTAAHKVEANIQKKKKNFFLYFDISYNAL